MYRAIVKDIANSDKNILHVLLLHTFTQQLFKYSYLTTIKFEKVNN